MTLGALERSFFPIASVSFFLFTLRSCSFLSYISSLLLSNAWLSTDSACFSLSSRFSLCFLDLLVLSLSCVCCYIMWLLKKPNYLISASKENKLKPQHSHIIINLNNQLLSKQGSFFLSSFPFFFFKFACMLGHILWFIITTP